MRTDRQAPARLVGHLGYCLPLKKKSGLLPYGSRLSATAFPDVRVPDVGVIFLLYRSSLINQSPPPLATSCRSTCVSAGNITPADEQSESDRAVVGDKKLDRKRYRFGFKSAAAAVGYMY